MAEENTITETPNQNEVTPESNESQSETKAPEENQTTEPQAESSLPVEDPVQGPIDEVVSEQASTSPEDSQAVNNVNLHANENLANPHDSTNETKPQDPDPNLALSQSETKAPEEDKRSFIQSVIDGLSAPEKTTLLQAIKSHHSSPHKQEVKVSLIIDSLLSAVGKSEEFGTEEKKTISEIQAKIIEKQGQQEFMNLASGFDSFLGNPSYSEEQRLSLLSQSLDTYLSELG
ncbi:hypothetical protein [Leptospira sp. GIMC2001]|uniref:hypothetical protein n=1 Tax=Leptospira sp. GIMC2001 TaxID=1513297 RepID=UPI00234A0AB1|nr:hypothetical protein [Leptospira sp. GIMC2001]WCL51497.1 hypothetical protein O4O04_19980 [Leptospira sp. GIMC2001]